MIRTIKNDIFAGGILILLAFTLSLVHLGSPDLKLAGRLRKQVLRFHVIADSNQKTDQDLKLEVRSFLLDRISQGLAEESGSSRSKESTASYVRLHKNELEQDANEFIRNNGFSYEAEIEVGVSHFPTKTYGDMLFPAGDYDAVRVVGQRKRTQLVVRPLPFSLFCKRYCRCGAGFFQTGAGLCPG
mgnify:CR=1 FL=1